MRTHSGAYYSGNFTLDTLVHRSNPLTSFQLPDTSVVPHGGSTHPATDPDVQKETVRVPVDGPLRRRRQVHWIPPAIRHAFEHPRDGDAASTGGALGMWWVEVVHGPMNIIEKVWLTLRMVGGWVVWNYTDLMEQFQRWDGTWFGLVRHTHILWRASVVALLTLGILEVAPLLEMITQWVGMLFELVRFTFSLAGSAVEELWYLLSRVYDDLTGLVTSVRG